MYRIGSRQRGHWVYFDLESDRMRNSTRPEDGRERAGRRVFRAALVGRQRQFGTLMSRRRPRRTSPIPTRFRPSAGPRTSRLEVRICRTYYGQYYAPNNAVMLIAGDVDPDEIFRLADQYLAGLEAQAAPPPVTTREPPQLGERRLRIVREAQTPLIAMAWHTSAAPDRESRVMEVLLSILVPATRPDSTSGSSRRNRPRAGGYVAGPGLRSGARVDQCDRSTGI